MKTALKYLVKGATTVDKWVLSKLQGVIATCRAAYEAYDFRRVAGGGELRLAAEKDCSRLVEVQIERACLSAHSARP